MKNRLLGLLLLSLTTGAVSGETLKFEGLYKIVVSSMLFNLNWLSSNI